ncbi:hypothetical protein BGW38_003132 [Lunasporangiospora selenospora]|uniref:Uncharacterized protein n=1 Tax=Lunasporangiospora selenospora TaxID=979761 RepID=A0A9P6KCF1_9FUNG|nr:hypothetical protein BGW38_003132 [Lunasporangiospora selenospora]
MGTDGDTTAAANFRATVVSFVGAVGDTGPAASPRPHFDLNSLRHITQTMAGFDMGVAFRLLQKKAASFINDDRHKVAIKNLCRSANSIWDTSKRLPEMSTNTHRTILSEIEPTVTRLSPEKTRLFLDLSYEFSTSGRVRSRALESEEDENLLHPFQDLSRKLPSVTLHSIGSREQRGDANKPDCTIMKGNLSKDAEPADSEIDDGESITKKKRKHKK